MGNPNFQPSNNNDVPFLNSYEYGIRRRVPWKSNPYDDDDDDHDNRCKRGRRTPNCSDVVVASIPHFANVALKMMAGVTVALYILNQTHNLPRPLSAIVSKGLFWPTLPITASRRIGQWTTRVDDTVLIGGAPFGFSGMPENLYEQHGVRGVINLCAEYKGPVRKYKNLGMEELYLPTTDHFEPEVEDMISAVAFIRRHQAQGNKVYVHCRAGHGRSAAIVFAWMLYKDPIVDTQQLNSEFCKLRNVRKTLWKQPNIKMFHDRLKTKGTLVLDMKESSKDTANASIKEKSKAFSYPATVTRAIVDDYSSSSENGDEW